MAYNQITQGAALAGDVIIEDNSVGAPVPRTSKVAMTAATGAGGALAWANPTGATIIVTKIDIHITTGSGTATIDAGVAANATTSNDTLIDGQSTATAGVINSAVHHGTNGAGAVAVTSSQYITGSISGTIGSFAGNAYITWIPTDF